ncbi:MAG: DUF2318 domain-containing protein [Candidatus Odinarchaeota archaeon]
MSKKDSMNREQIQEPKVWKKQSKERNLFVPIMLISVIGFASILILSQNSNPTNTANQVGEELQISLSELSTNAKFYQYKSDGVAIRYFAVKGPDGNYHVALDACDVCYQEKQGYIQQSNLMKCNNCGWTFAINSIGTENLQGGCWPSHVPVKIDGSSIIIKISDLVNKKFMFA